MHRHTISSQIWRDSQLACDVTRERLAAVGTGPAAVTFAVSLACRRSGTSSVSATVAIRGVVVRRRVAGVPLLCNPPTMIRVEDERVAKKTRADRAGKKCRRSRRRDKGSERCSRVARRSRRSDRPDWRKGPRVLYGRSRLFRLSDQETSQTNWVWR